MCLHRKIEDFFLDELKRLIEFQQNKIIRLEVSIDHELEPLQWLSQQKSLFKTYWSDRHNRFTMAGIGAADLVFSQERVNTKFLFERLRQHLSCQYSQVRYYGGISFQQTKEINSPWQDFGNHLFLVPKFEIYRDESGTYFACNFLVNCDNNSNEQLQQTLQELASINFSLSHQQLNTPQVSRRVNSPNQLEWYRNVNKGLTYINQENLEKIVLARKSEFTIVNPCKPEHLLSLIQKEQHCSFDFCFQPNRDKGFVGCTPERLYWRQCNQIQTEAIAGTSPRGNSFQEDEKLAQELLSSPKEIREHQVVVKSLQESLANLCNRIDIGNKPGLLRLNKLQHLHTNCSGILHPGIDDVEIINQLHPTPAVGGYPRQQALELIAKLETFDRGWYGSPVGWVGFDSAEFAVAIRSGLIHKNKITLFAGAGIVAGSQPETEWEELENKISNFLQIVDLVD
ncbi:MAG: isochorismate synthase [Pleurocapsa sp. MO_226.B13]|nr:isochorismate synthase [Pleurocapsa sp. MO_226.B13]